MGVSIYLVKVRTIVGALTGIAEIAFAIQLYQTGNYPEPTVSSA